MFFGLSQVKKIPHAGLVISVMGELDILECTTKDVEIDKKWTELAKLLYNCKYKITDKVNGKAYSLFNNLLLLVKERYGIDMPNHSL